MWPELKAWRSKMMYIKLRDNCHETIFVGPFGN